MTEFSKKKKGGNPTGQEDDSLMQVRNLNPYSKEFKFLCIIYKPFLLEREHFAVLEQSISSETLRILNFVEVPPEKTIYLRTVNLTMETSICQLHCIFI